MCHELAVTVRWPAAAKDEPLVPRLAGQGLTVRVLTRDLSRARRLAGPGVEVVRGDVRDRAAVASALRGAGTVISAVHGFAGPGMVAPASVARRATPA